MKRQRKKRQDFCCRRCNWEGDNETEVINFIVYGLEVCRFPLTFRDTEEPKVFFEISAVKKTRLSI